jgi:hypothetical protein
MRRVLLGGCLLLCGCATQRSMQEQRVATLQATQRQEQQLSVLRIDSLLLSSELELDSLCVSWSVSDSVATPTLQLQARKATLRRKEQHVVREEVTSRQQDTLQLCATQQEELTQEFRREPLYRSLWGVGVLLLLCVIGIGIYRRHR